MRRLDGTLPDYAQALLRSALVFVKGVALCLPIIPLFVMSWCRIRLMQLGMTSWDEHTGLRVEHGEPEPWRYLIVAIVAGFVALVFATSLAAGLRGIHPDAALAEVARGAIAAFTHGPRDRLFRPGNPAHRQRRRRLAQQARNGHLRRRDLQHASSANTASTPRTPCTALIDQLRRADLVVGFNHISFDYGVLRGCSVSSSPTRLQSLDLMLDLEKKLGHRPKLDAVASATLGAGKTADGLEAIRWWQQAAAGEGKGRQTDLGRAHRRHRASIAATTSGPPCGSMNTAASTAM